MTQILSLSANNTQVKVGDTLEVSVSHSNDGTATATLTARLFFNGDKLAFVSSTVVTGQPLGTPVPVADSNNTDGIDETNFVIQYTNGGFSAFPAQETVIFKVTFTVLETFDDTQMVVNGTGRVNTVLEQQTLPITLEVNQPPTAVNITNSIDLAENTVIGDGVKVGDIAVTDDGLGTNVLSLTGTDASSFAIRGMELFYIGASPDFETKNQYQVTVNVDDDTVGDTPDATTDFTLNITDVNEAPTAVTLANTITELAENTIIGEGIKVGDIAVTDDALGTNVLSLTGTDASSFAIRGTELFYIAASPDFETKNQYQVTVNVDDDTVGETPDATTNFTLNITDVNEAPTAVNITNAIELAENTVIGEGIKVGNIVVTDDALGTNVLSLTGTDASSFAIRGTELFYIGASPDFETKNQYQVTVNVDDDTVGENPDATTDFTLNITDVNEAPVVSQPIADQTARETNAFNLTIPADTFKDPDGDTLSLSAFLEDGTTPLPSWLTFDAETLTFSGTPSSIDVGTVNVGVFANDGEFTTSDVFTITIEPSNNPPSITSPDVFNLPENTTAVGTIEATDPDMDDTIAFSISGGVDLALFNIDPTTGALSFISAPNFENPLDDGGDNIYDVVVTVTDQGGLTAEQSIAVTVEDVNEAPVVSQPIVDQTAQEANAFNLTIPAGTFTDPDGDTLFFSATLEDGTTPLPSWLTFDAETLTFSGTPSSGDVGTVNVGVFANDGEFTTSDVFTITIEPLPSPSLAISATDANKEEGNEGVTPFTFTVTRSENTTGALTVNYAVTGSGANPANAVDFGGTLPTGSVAFADGETTKVVTINVNGDLDVESNETFTVTITAPNTNITTGSAVGTIINDDQAPPTPSLAISATDANKNEGNQGVTPFTFTVTRSENTTGALTVNYAVTGSGDNPADAVDFGGTLPSGSVEFADGETEKVVTIDVSGDVDFEADETFTVTLTPVDGVDITTGSAVGTIVNDDAPVVNASSFPDGVIITAPNPNTATTFIADSRDNTFEPSTASDLFDLTLGGANTIQGTLAQLDEDIVEGFDRNDQIRVEGSALSADQVKVTFSSAILELDSNNDGNTDSTITLEGDFNDALFLINQGENSTDINYDILNTRINRFQNEDRPGTYLFAGEDESQSIRQNFPNFIEEGYAFNVTTTDENDRLFRLNRFQNSDVPGTYLFAGEDESVNIRANFPNFIEEGIAAYVAAPGSSTGEAFYRFQNTEQLGTYIFVGEQERDNILANFPQFVLEGVAFEVVA